MKKTTFKRIAASIAALCICSMAVAPVVADAATITINSASDVSVNDKDFVAYKVFGLTSAAEGYFVTSTNTAVNDYFKNKITEEEYTDLNTAISNYVSALDAEGTKDLARDLLPIVKAQAAVANSGVTSSTATGAEGSVVFAGLDTGYYLIEDTSALPDDAVSSVMLKNSDDTTEITLKADKPTIIKKIDENGTLVDTNTACVGDNVKYHLESVVPDTTYYDNYTFKMTDTFEAGLDVVYDAANKTGVTIYLADKDGTKVKDLVNGTDYTVVLNAAADGHNENMYIYFTDMKALGTKDDTATTEVEGYEGLKIIVEYEATVNEDAKIGTTGNVNDIVLEYSNNPNQSADNDLNDDGIPDDEDDNPDNDENLPENPTTETEHDKVITYLTQVKIKKVDQNGDALGKVDGETAATFKISGEGVQYIVKESTNAAGEKVVTVSSTDLTATNTAISAEVDAKGFLVFSGLGAGTYTITETAPPDGYNGLPDDITVTITCNLEEEVSTGAETCAWTYDSTGDDETTSAGEFIITVMNRQGALFPSTGGIGTTIFTVVGVSLMAGAAGAFAIKRKAMNK